MSEATINIVNYLSDQHRHDLVELYKNEFWCNDREISDVEVMLNNTDIVIGLERNQQSETISNETRVRVLKNRFSGQTGHCDTLHYDNASGRYSPDVFKPSDETNNPF